MRFVIVWLNLEVASRQRVAATGRATSPVTSQKVGDYPEPSSGMNGVDMEMGMDGEGEGSIEVNR